MDDDEAARFDELYEHARDRVARQIAALTGDTVEAADHVQEAFIRAWDRWRVVGAMDDPEAWVRRVAYNLAISRWRRARRLVLRAHPADGPTLVLDDDQGSVMAALLTLPRGQREAIVLHHLINLPVVEVADWLGVPQNTVKSWLARGRRHLAVTLQDTTAPEELPS